MKLLAAIDLSNATEPVIVAARRVAEATGAEVFLVHVAEPDPDFVGYEAGPDVVREQVAREYREEHRKLQALAERLRGDAIRAKALLIQGPIAATLVEQAARLAADLIVVGSHGHGAVYDVVVGSVSLAVLRASPVPVIVVPIRG